uniref:ARAD1C04070p n=1 Tax=Blastobotrys adeninivorans TaxID=409370 RepID=A0A060SZX9_BLAAD
MSYEDDVEKAPKVSKAVEDQGASGEDSVEYTTQGPFRRFVDSFKRKDVSDWQREGLTDVEIAARATAEAPLARDLKGRHIQMIAIGGAIGTGLFVGSGTSLSTGGPAGVLIAYLLVGSMLFCTVQALGELAVRFPISGSFATLSTRFIDPAWGFAMGWNYALQWLVVFPLELVAASLTIQFWRTDGSAAATVNPDAWVAIFYVVVAVINIFGVRGYGEAEFVFSIIKVTAVIGFIIFGIVINCGGGPHHEYIGGRYWHDPGAFASGAKGVIAVFVSAAFAFAGTELVGLASAETANPKKTLPRAAKQVFWRILIFYVVGLAIVGLLVPYNDPRLLSGTSSADATASPFVIAINNAGVRGLPSVINVVILIAVLSVGNSAVFACSRTVAALAAQKMCPKIFAYVDRKGRPIVAIGATLIFGLLCFLAGSDKQAEVFDWLLAFSGLSSVVTWGTICLVHIRFRRALYAQGMTTDVLAFKASLGVWGSVYGFTLNFLVICLQFWIALFPVGGSPDAEAFFKTYLTVPVVLVFYFGYKIWHWDWRIYFRADNIDVVTGVRELDMDRVIAENEEEKAAIRSRGFLYRTYRWWC